MSAPGSINRRKARELALQLLYAREVGELSRPGELEPVIEASVAHLRCGPELRTYGLGLYEAVRSNIAQIDNLLSVHADKWDLHRMATIDRNLLRLGVAEMMHFPQAPYKVVIDEAVELAKRYSGDQSSKFVNGVLDAVRKNLPGNGPHTN